MSIKNRAYLKTKFKTGDKPTEIDFKDFLDSFYNKQDEPVFTQAEATARFEPKAGNIFGPWVDVNEANSNIVPDLRRVGLTVGILTGGLLLEYWYAEGIEDAHLVKKESGKVDTVNGVVADQNKNVLLGAENINFEPAESNNTTGFFAGKLTAGKLLTSAALNYIVSELKATISGLSTTNGNVTTVSGAVGTLANLTTTAKDSLVNAVNEVKAAALTSASDVTKQVSKDIIFCFDEVSIDSEAEIFLTRKMLVNGAKKSGAIDGFVFYARTDAGTYSGVLANFGNVNTWLGTNITPGVNYWLKAVQTPITGGVGPGAVTLDFKETV